RTLPQAFRELVERHALTVIGLGVYLALKIDYYGDFFPNTYYAKAADAAPLEAGLSYVESFMMGSPYAYLLLPFALLGGVSAFRGAEEASGPARFGLIAVALHVAYVI